MMMCISDIYRAQFAVVFTMWMKYVVHICCSNI